MALLENAGINFEKLKKDGIDREEFKHFLLSLNLCMNRELIWLCYHGCYDIAYLIKLIVGGCNSMLSSSNKKISRGLKLPPLYEQFAVVTNIYFPYILDLKVICRNLLLKDQGLAKLAISLNCNRIGQAHQAGSDSLLTGEVFFKLKKIAEMKFIWPAVFECCLNTVHGLGRGISAEDFSWFISRKKVLRHNMLMGQQQALNGRTMASQVRKPLIQNNSSSENELEISNQSDSVSSQDSGIMSEPNIRSPVINKKPTSVNRPTFKEMLAKGNNKTSRLSTNSKPLSSGIDRKPKDLGIKKCLLSADKKSNNHQVQVNSKPTPSKSLQDKGTGTNKKHSNGFTNLTNQKNQKILCLENQGKKAQNKRRKEKDKDRHKQKEKRKTTERDKKLKILAGLRSDTDDTDDTSESDKSEDSTMPQPPSKEQKLDNETSLVDIESSKQNIKIVQQITKNNLNIPTGNNSRYFLRKIKTFLDNTFLKHDPYWLQLLNRYIYHSVNFYKKVVKQWIDIELVEYI